MKKFEKYINEATKLKVGDVVQYSKEFAKSLGAQTSHRGKIKKIVDRDYGKIALVKWMLPIYSSMKPSEINVTILEKVKKRKVAGKWIYLGD